MIIHVYSEPKKDEGEDEDNGSHDNVNIIFIFYWIFKIYFYLPHLKHYTECCIISYNVNEHNFEWTMRNTHKYVISR